MEQGIYFTEQFGIVHNLDPVLFSIGSLHIRYYGVIFALTLLAAFALWNWQMRRGGYSAAMSENFIIYGVIATIVGSRIGHCLFYEWDIYSADPLRILRFWEGGLASHGAGLGLLIALYIYARKYKVTYLELLDRFSFAVMAGAAGVRLGNFVNSEIVGRVTTVSWGVRFMWGKNIEEVALRHPSQLYEFFMGLFLLGLLVIIDRIAGKEKRPLGLLSGVFLTGYFLLRFCVEFFKEYQTGLVSTAGLTMGQYLSIIPCIVGVGLIIWSLYVRKSTAGSTCKPE